MSIEDNMERIAGSLERIANALGNKQSSLDLTVPVAAPVEAPVAAPVVEAPVAAPVVAAPVVAAPVSTGVVVMTPEAFNDALVAEFSRIGSREPIDAAFKDFGALNINDLQPEQYSDVLKAVKAIKS